MIILSFVLSQSTKKTHTKKKKKNVENIMLNIREKYPIFY